ncbi:MAG: hypothetical protein ABSB80_08880 [Methanoregula sp.]|jgi:hypothetical protein|uniref:hypothetical protein n=1 Tax=Methanoregula sp. TaxID=2052170 RepID=UPI003D0F18A1
MKKRIGIFSCILLLLLIGAASAAAGSTSTSTGTSTGSATTTTLSPEQALSQISVTSVTLDPLVFYPGESGTITVQVMNSGTQSVALRSASILDANIVVVGDTNPYNTMIYLGPGNTMTYSFVVTATTKAGTYFPLFTLASRDAGSIRYPIQVEVEANDIHAAISLKPDNFAVSTNNNVNLSIVNTRDGPVGTIVVTPEADGVVVSPSQAFVSSLDGGSNVQIPFDIIPSTGTNVTFHITYQNGVMNEHSTDVVLPLNFGENKAAVVPVINDLALVNQGGVYQLTGDVTNAGITDANGLVLMVGSPAIPQEPYSTYAVGSLTSNDFSSFTLTFTANDLSDVPVLIQWKDVNGNTLSTTKNLDLRSLVAYGTAGTRSSSGSSGTTGGSAAGSSAAAAGGGGQFRGGGGGIGGIFGGGGRGGGLAAFYPVIAGGIIVIIAIVLWMKRKWILSKLKKQ